MKRIVLFLCSLFLTLFVLGCAIAKPTNVFQSNNTLEHRNGELLLKARFSCLDCEQDEAVVVTLSYGFANELPVTTLDISFDAPGFEVRTDDATTFDVLDEDDLVSFSGIILRYNRQIRFALSPTAEDFAWGTLSIQAQSLDEEPVPLAEIRIGYAIDEEGLHFATTESIAMEHSLNGLYDAGIIDVEEYVRREFCFLLEDNVHFGRIESGIDDDLLRYQSATLRITVAIPKSHPVSVEFFRLWTLYEAERPVGDDWRSEEVKALIVAYLMLLLTQDLIDDEVFAAESAALEVGHAIFQSLKNPTIASARFGNAIHPYVDLPINSAY